MMQIIRSILLLVILVVLNACTALSDMGRTNANDRVISVNVLTASHPKQAPRDTVCFAAFTALDQLALQAAGTLIGSRIPNMPWLRHNRLTKHEIDVQIDAKKLSTLLQSMSSLANQGLLYESAMIPKNQVLEWQKRYQIKQSIEGFIHQCSVKLINQQLRSAKKTLARLKTIAPDNDYSMLARVAGLYPLAVPPFRLGVVKEQRQLAEEWGDINNKQWFKYYPEGLSRFPSHRAQQSWPLLNRHAPTWLVDSTTRANQPGAPYWQGRQLTVNKQATTYAFISEARWKEQRITQLNYIIWFAERPRLKRLDWVAGQHDAVVFRVNLNEQGEVIAYDSIHLCGCWYRLFLPKNRPFVRNNRYWHEPVLMKRVRLPDRNRPNMAVYLQADTHQIQYVQPIAEMAVDDEVVAVSHYLLTPFTQLLKLPTASGGTRPVFNRKGYVSGSERPERWLFWPMGVRNPGALRRFGDHAISFVGRRYFDDPRLLEKVSGFDVR